MARISRYNMMLRHIDSMRRLRYSAEAVPKYDFLSGAVFWADEIPPDIPFSEIGFLRRLLSLRISRLRSKQVCGIATKDVLWDQFFELCPSWPGFRPERCDSDETLCLQDRLKKDSGEGGARP